MLDKLGAASGNGGPPDCGASLAGAVLLGAVPLGTVLLGAGSIGFGAGSMGFGGIACAGILALLSCGLLAVLGRDCADLPSAGVPKLGWVSGWELEARLARGLAAGVEGLGPVRGIS